MNIWPKALSFVVVGTLGFLAFGVLVGLGACASVQGLSVCLDYFARALSTLL